MFAPRDEFIQGSGHAHRLWNRVQLARQFLEGLVGSAGRGGTHDVVAEDEAGDVIDVRRLGLLLEPDPSRLSPSLLVPPPSDDPNESADEEWVPSLEAFDMSSTTFLAIASAFPRSTLQKIPIAEATITVDTRFSTINCLAAK